MTRTILAIDTSTTVSVAVTAGPRWAMGGSDDPRGHTESVAPLVQGLLEQAGVTPADVTDVVVVPLTPGHSTTATIARLRDRTDRSPA